ncbi:MAG: RNA polymerase sigma factor [Silicimonas sp.]|jgi:RNA polymerase sigma-70 factor (ECF subfamily)|nr:RNA polymerase sigma factor [Silicimonas sp.]
MDRTPASDAPDAALLVAYANGDSAAGRDLLSRLAPRLFGYAARVLGDHAEAEDVVQETMLRLWRIAPEWRQGEAQVSTWVYRVAVNLCTDRLRRRRTRGQVDIDAVAEPASDMASAVEAMTEKDRADALQAALDTLPERQRQAVVLRHIEGLANAEIAEIMDIGIEAVESLTARGKRALKAVLSGRKEELGYENG